MKTREITTTKADQNKAFFIVTVSFVASLVLSMTMIGLAVNYVLHNS